jgi:hypothetical protein
METVISKCLSRAIIYKFASIEGLTVEIVARDGDFKHFLFEI